jgi:fructosamine-3-kinase
MRGSLIDIVTERLGRTAESCRALGGGCVGEVYRVRMKDGEDIVVKHDSRPSPALDIEGYMLRHLAEHSALPVPQVLHSSPDLLAMEFIDGESRFDTRAQHHAAELLAALHGIGAPQYGLDRATLIGGLHQPNPWTDSWVAFFRDHRLLHMADKALEECVMPPTLHKRIHRFAERLHDFIDEPAHPSLLHGDVWATNVLAQNGRITGFIDPAVYYGHPEIELAFITLFNTFGAPFFDAYNTLRPIIPGFFEQRRDIYNLYPLLVHTRLFGASYLSGVEHTLGRLGF